jgi:8-oxo-dGTP pyrophosphatase MutT (NUDIX family)
MEHSTEFPDCFHRVAVKGLCVRDGKVLMSLDNVLNNGVWELPGGGLDFGESIPNALAREVQEEMGLKVTKMSERPIYVWTHKLEGKRGLKWFYLCIIAYRVEFEDLNITPSKECEEVRFFSKEDLQQSTKLNDQMKGLAELFNPEDFTEPF